MPEAKFKIKSRLLWIIEKGQSILNISDHRQSTSKKQGTISYRNILMYCNEHNFKVSVVHGQKKVKGELKVKKG